MQSKVEPPGLDAAEEPLLWEGLTLNKCILVASVVALLSVTFQLLQGESGAARSGKGRPDRAAPPGSCLSPPLLQRHAPRRGSPAAGRNLRPLPFPVGPRLLPPPGSPGSSPRQAHTAGRAGPGSPCLGYPPKHTDSVPVPSQRW